MKRFFVLAILFASIAAAWAQEGPLLPCPGCDQLIHAPYPENGSWYNPEQPGSGLNLEIQDGYLLGYFYGYEATGRASWLMISGPLTRSEKAGVAWELESTFQRYEGGNCQGCAYQPPTEPTTGDTVRLEFKQRNYLRISIADEFDQYFVPLIYGSVGRTYFEESAYIFPEYGSFFALLYKPAPDEPWDWSSVTAEVKKGRIEREGEFSGDLIYDIVVFPPQGGQLGLGVIQCIRGVVPEEGGCILRTNTEPPTACNMPIAQMSDSRFFCEQENGTTIEGFRLMYD